MKISLKWLRELCPSDLSDDQIAERLTSIGLEVEGREVRALPAKADVVSAAVREKTPVSGSDHLNVCQVDTGAGALTQVVCGAANYQVGDVVPLARVGAELPGGLKIGKAKLRGVESFGMLCSARELGLAEDGSGLMLLPRDAPLGKPLGELLGLPDTVLELNVTPNRPDALSHLGVARELAAATGARLKLPASALSAEKPDGGAALAAIARVEVDDAQGCPRYLARVVEGLTIRPSPLSVQERLRACGIRPINNVVDATNLVLLELGHPMHAFDLDKLDGGLMRVRRARSGEKLTTLDGKERLLDPSDLVNADASRSVGLAGVMGGQTSEVSGSTARVLLESAVFDGSSVRRTARRQALHTEASHRFERGADERAARLAIDRCAELIAAMAGGRVLPGLFDRCPEPRPLARVWVRPARVSALLGTPVEAAEVDARLSALGLAAVDGTPERRLWEIPSHRRDLTREVDCVEEIARLRGLDTIPMVVPKAGVGETAAPAAGQVAQTRARAALSARGYDEVLNYSFVAEGDLSALVPAISGVQPGPVLRVANPLSSEQGAMRTSLLPGLLRTAKHNLARGAVDLRIYELGRVYLPEPNPAHAEGALAWPVNEVRRLGLLALGHEAQRSWAAPAAALDFYDLKGAVEDLLEALGVAGAARFHAAPSEISPSLHPTSATWLELGGRRAGVFGQLHPLVAQAFELPAATFVAELDWSILADAAVRVRKLSGIPKFPAVSRDLALVVDAGVPAERMEAEIRAADAQGLLESVLLFDVYRGPQVPAGKKSLAYGLSLRASDRTLTDAEADALLKSVQDRLRSAVGAEIRA